MFKKTLEFEDFNGNTVRKDFYFHWSKTEIVEMTVSGVGDRLHRIVTTKDSKEMFDEFKAIIQSSVGIRSEDGLTFDKSPEAQAQFMNSPAFDTLMLELMTNAEGSAEFIKMLLPEKMQKELKAQLEGANLSGSFSEPEDNRPAWVRENRDPTYAELVAMDSNELRAAFAAKMSAGPKP